MKKSSSLLVLFFSMVGSGCYDFNKVYLACMDTPDSCTGPSNLGGANGTGSNFSGGTPGSGSTSGGGSSGSNTGGSGGSNTGGSNTGGSNTGGATTGGSNTGGSGTGGVATVEEIGRLRLVEACPGVKAVELQNTGPTDIGLSGLYLSVSAGASGFNGCSLGSGTLTAGDFMVITKVVGGCSGITVPCVDNCSGLSFSSTAASASIYDGSAWTTIDGFDASVVPPIGQCWYIPSGGSVATVGGSSIGFANP